MKVWTVADNTVEIGDCDVFRTKRKALIFIRNEYKPEHYDDVDLTSFEVSITAECMMRVLSGRGYARNQITHDVRAILTGVSHA